MSTTLVEIGKRIQEARSFAKLTQAELGKRLGVQGPAVSRYENGTVDPGAIGLGTIASLAKVSIDWLITGEGPGPNEEISKYIHGSSEPPKGLSVADAVIMHAVIEGIEEYLEEDELELRPSKKADLVLTLFEMCMEEGKEVDKATIVRLVRLAA